MEALTKMFKVSQHVYHDEDDWLLAAEPDEPLPAQRMPAEPTGYGPGSEQKIEVMCRRLARQEHIHHPMDVRTCGELPVAVVGRTYVQARPGLSLRTRGGKTDYFVSVRYKGIQVVKRFSITEYEAAVEFLESTQQSGLVGMREEVSDLLAMLGKS